MAQVIILTPLFLPVVKAAGVDPIHFGIIFVMNCEVGYLTPPLGTSLFVAMGISKSTLGQISLAVLPFIVTMLLAIAIVCYFPGMSTVLPDLFNIR
jgi:C4-dicarboxylate transporter DctM subunit